MTEFIKTPYGQKKVYNPQNYGLSYQEFKDLPINQHQGQMKGRYYCPRCHMIWHKGSLIRGRGQWRCPHCHSPVLIRNPFPEVHARKVA